MAKPGFEIGQDKTVLQSKDESIKARLSQYKAITRPTKMRLSQEKARSRRGGRRQDSKTPVGLLVRAWGDEDHGLCLLLFLRKDNRENNGEVKTR
jgi:hypothetical protein